MLPKLADDSYTPYRLQSQYKISIYVVKPFTYLPCCCFFVDFVDVVFLKKICLFRHIDTEQDHRQ